MTDAFDLEGASPREIQKRYSDTIEAAIAKAKASGERVALRAEGLVTVYAKPSPHGVAWEIMDFEGATIRGIRRPNGSDIAVS
jgi:hypothetical protein